MVFLHDSLTQAKQKIKFKRVSIYNCGPTVYDHIHIGNARPLITFDVLVRLLEFCRFKVNYVHNITDIDDKIIQKALDTATDELEVARYYTDAYLTIMKALNVKQPTKLVKVTEHVAGIIAYINKISQHKATYFQNGELYFAVNKLNNYGILSKQKIFQLQQSSRNQTSHKQQEHDFLLWKKTNVGLTWDSPWGLGRPGWHTECAYFINRFIGKQVTIHGGGVDLKFPHHENENAQNYVLYRRSLAKIWMHVGHVNVAGIKMSKSLGNFVLMRDLLRCYEANTIRWFYYQTSYLKPLNFVNDNLVKIQTQLHKIVHQINVTQTYLILFDEQVVLTHAKMVRLGQKTPEFQGFLTALMNNLNFPNAITVIEQLINTLNLNYRNQDCAQQNLSLVASLKLMFWLLGLKLPHLHNARVVRLIKRWHHLVTEQDYVAADAIRERLMTLKVL